MEDLSEATQEYLESIYWLYEAGIERTQANLARALQVSQPSASEMLRRLGDDGNRQNGDHSRSLRGGGQRAGSDEPEAYGG